MDERIEIRYREHEIARYQRDILTLDVTQLFLPVTFILKKGSVTGVYRTGGRNFIRENETSDASYHLAAVETLLTRMIRAQRYYLFPGDYTVHPHLLLIRPGARGEAPDPALIWRKNTVRSGQATDIGRVEIVSGLCDILRALEEKTKPEGLVYLERAVEVAAKSSAGLEMLRQKLCGLREEAYGKGL